MNRPLGVSIFAILQGLGALFLFLAGAGFLLTKDMFAEVILNTPELQASLGDIPPASLGMFLTFAGVLSLVFGVLALISAIGLWGLKTWGWQLAVALQILSIVSNLAQLMTGIADVGGIIFSIMVAALILVYFMRPPVKRAFGIGRKADSPTAVEDETDF